MMNGEYGIEDVCLSVLNVVDEKGAHSKVMVPLTDEELEALHNSANVLKDLIKNLDI
jgi:L-lactate dehydrogenase